MLNDKSKEILNTVQSMIIDVANDNNVSLADEFETVDAFKQFVIAFTLHSLKEMGVEMQDAWDIVMGEGSYDRLVESVWNKARKAG